MNFIKIISLVFSKNLKTKVCKKALDRFNKIYGAIQISTLLPLINYYCTLQSKQTFSILRSQVGKFHRK